MDARMQTEEEKASGTGRSGRQRTCLGRVRDQTEGTTGPAAKKGGRSKNGKPACGAGQGRDDGVKTSWARREQTRGGGRESRTRKGGGSVGARSRVGRPKADSERLGQTRKEL